MLDMVSTSRFFLPPRGELQGFAFVDTINWSGVQASCHIGKLS